MIKKETIIIHPTSKEQANLFEQLAKVLNVPFEKEEESPYDPKFVAKIKKGEKAAKEGKGLKVDPPNLWK
jgi:hypothetical protein